MRLPVYLDYNATALRPRPSASLLDAGRGTGHFSCSFTVAGLCATGVDPDPVILAHARTRSAGLDLDYVRADARVLPFPDAWLPGVLPWTGFLAVHIAGRKA